MLGYKVGWFGGKVGSDITEFTVSWGTETHKPVIPVWRQPGPHSGSGRSELKPLPWASLAGRYLGCLHRSRD